MGWKMVSTNAGRSRSPSCRSSSRRAVVSTASRGTALRQQPFVHLGHPAAAQGRQRQQADEGPEGEPQAQFDGPRGRPESGRADEQGRGREAGEREQQREHRPRRQLPVRTARAAPPQRDLEAPRPQAPVPTSEEEVEPRAEHAEDRPRKPLVRALGHGDRDGGARRASRPARSGSVRVVPPRTRSSPGRGAGANASNAPAATVPPTPPCLPANMRTTAAESSTAV